MEDSFIHQYINDNKHLLFQTLQELCAIPAPSGKEEKRAAYCKEWLESVGAKGVYIDEAKNVVFPLNCEDSNDICVFVAHTDTVFPDTEPMPYREDDVNIYCPGVGDDTASLAVLLLLAKFYVTHTQKPTGGFLFVCNSCEEGLGNLKGTRRIFQDYNGRITRFISFDSSHKPYLNTSKINNYASRMASRYDQDGEKRKFKTTGGSYISIMVPYSGASVDTGALAEDIRSCLQNKTSGTRTAPYIDQDVLQDMPYGGTYIEINLSSQHIWMYKNGTCVASGPLVSGCVYDGNRTPTGVYSIRSKSRNTYLVGPTWRDFVQYWMPFAGAVGLHDASWRSSFGGDIYLYEGSHGCVNLPANVAGDIYNNAKVGTKVIVYGGASKANPVTQTINGTTSYALTVDTPSFLLDAAPAYGSYALNYSSSNTSVVEVSSDGTVTVKGPGSATITVSLPAQAFYTAAELRISITVTNPCSGGHTYGEWSVTKEPTCAAGTETRVCSVCGKKDTRSVDPVLDHSYSEWTVTKEPTCAAGEQTRTCSTCGHTETQSVAPVSEHSYGEWTVTKEASCASAGEKACTCSACGHTKTESIGKTEHDYSSGGQYCGNGCGTVNPGYTDPSEETTAE